MSYVPAGDRKPCIFRVVHVSGTVRKAEEEAVRRARELMIAVEDEARDNDAGTLNKLFGRPGKPSSDVAMSDPLDAGDASGSRDASDGRDIDS